MSGRVAAAAMAMALIAMSTNAQADGREPSDRKTLDLAQAQPAPTAEQRTFDIPPQPLVTALNVFGRQAGVQISVDESIARGVQVQGVSGTMSPEQALNTLLTGTGIVARFTGPRAVMLTKAQAGGLPPGVMQLDPVQVQGVFPVPPQAMIDNIPPPYAGGQVARGGQLGLLGNRGVMDTPFNQTSYTAKKAEDQQAQSVRDVLMDDPSVRFATPDGGPGNDNMYIRGFRYNPVNVAYGGLFSMLPVTTIMPEIGERVEILKGPSAMLNGMTPNASSTGGLINIVPKRAPDQGLTRITAGYSSSAQFGGHADVARRFGPEKEFGVRFNGVFKAGETAIENNSDQQALSLIGLDYRGERFRLSADGGYQYQYIGGLQSYLSVANGVALPWAPDARKNQGQPWGYQERKDLFGTVRGEFDVSDRVTAYAAFGAHDNRLTGLYVPTLIATNFNGAANANGPLNTSIYNTYLTGEVGVRALVDTGPIGHEFAVAATGFTTDSGQANIQTAAFASNFYNPTIIARPAIPTGAANKISTQGLSSFGFADTLSAVDKRIQLTAGVRFQRVTASNFNALTGATTSSYDQSAVSPSVALVFKPWENVSFYGNWIQGLQQGTTVPAPFANAGEVFAPYKSTQYEAGVKVDWGKLTTTLSVFQVAQPNVITNVANNTQFLGGEQKNQGLEINVFGEVADGVRILGGAMFLNAVLTKTAGGTNDGWIAPFAPSAQFNLAGEWDLPFAPGLTATGRITYTGAQFIDRTFPRRMLPEWTRLDVGVRYAFENPGAKGKLLVARFNVENLLDNDYWQGGDGVLFLSIGAPRTFRLSLSADF